MAEKNSLSRRDFIRLIPVAIGGGLLVYITPRSKTDRQTDTLLKTLISPTSTRNIPMETPTPTETLTSMETPTPTETLTSMETPTSTKETNLLTPEKIDFLAKHPINHGRTDEKIVIMTYDEGTRPENVEHLLNVYKTINGKCTFFMTGAGLEQSKDLLKRIVEEGHVIGYHSYEHINLAELTNEKITEQIRLWFDKFRSILPDYQVNYFRAPFGSKNTRVLNIAASFGLQHILWNVESGGTTPDTTKYVFDGFKLYKNYYQAVGGAIVLSHTHRSYDISQAEDIVSRWSDLGYQLITIDQGKMESDTWKG